jgi:DNA modification methylase
VSKFEIRLGNALAILNSLPSESVHCCVTSPPYWGLRDYGVPAQVWDADHEHRHIWGPPVLVNATNHTDKRRWNHARNGRGEEQPEEKRPGRDRHRIEQGNFCNCGAWRGSLGLEPTPELYVEHMVEVFRGVRRVLRADGTCWLNLGDSYARDEGKGHHQPGQLGKLAYISDGGGGRAAVAAKLEASGLKPKDLCGIPWRVAFALQADGWYLRSDVIWSKPNAMPESVTDRPTKAHEYLFLLSKSERYSYDAVAVQEKAVCDRVRGPALHPDLVSTNGNDGLCRRPLARVRNRRTVWTLATEPYSEAHFATYPTTLVEPCVKAGTSERGCCPECGASWRRMVETVSVDPIDYEGKWSDADPSASGRRMLANVRGRRQAGEDHDNPFPAPRTVGWAASCAHGHNPVPCTVLDPFCGSGTTGLVALRLGRCFIGIELNTSYVAMARKRIAGDAPLLNVEAGPGVVVA